MDGGWGGAQFAPNPEKDQGTPAPAQQSAEEVWGGCLATSSVHLSFMNVTPTPHHISPLPFLPTPPYLHTSSPSPPPSEPPGRAVHAASLPGARQVPLALRLRGPLRLAQPQRGGQPAAQPAAGEGGGVGGGRAGRGRGGGGEGCIYQLKLNHTKLNAWSTGRCVSCKR